MSDLSRRALLRTLPGAAAVTAVPAVAIVIPVADPILAAIAAQQVTWDAYGDTCSLTDSVLARQEGRTVTAADEAAHAAANDADEAAIDAITRTTPTTVAGAFAAIGVIRERGTDDHLDQMLATIFASPIAGGSHV